VITVGQSVFIIRSVHEGLEVYK